MRCCLRPWNLDVVDEDAEALHGPVADVREGDFDLRPCVRPEVHTPLLPTVGRAGRGVPDPGRAGWAAGVVRVERLVVVEPGMQGPPALGAADIDPDGRFPHHAKAAGADTSPVRADREPDHVWEKNTMTTTVR